MFVNYDIYISIKDQVGNSHGEEISANVLKYI